MDEAELESYWTNRYQTKLTGWDIGYPSTPIKTYIDQLTNKDIEILIPGAGHGYEAEYCFSQGFKNINVLDISIEPLKALQKRVPLLPHEQLIHGDFWNHEGQYDLIIEQTFFCSFEPSTEKRAQYGVRMNQLLRHGGSLVGLWFKHPLDKKGERPFGGTKEEYLSYLQPHFKPVVFEDCYNSIEPRAGKELFGIFKKL